ncbi:MAG TPA: four helix bundle protein [Opitutaceae bacterium]|nr:four helix bundle protein [Opitutaceae bacterium]
MNISRPSSIRFRFQKLDVWHDARQLNFTVYMPTQVFPIEEKYALTSQIRRGLSSIAANIAEGSGRNSDRDFAHFLEQAYVSGMELAPHLYVAFDLNYISEAKLDSSLESIRVLAAKIARLNKSLGVKERKVNFA